MFCARCGTRILGEDAFFCSTCGAEQNIDPDELRQPPAGDGKQEARERVAGASKCAKKGSKKPGEERVAAFVASAALWLGKTGLRLAEITLRTTAQVLVHLARELKPQADRTAQQAKGAAGRMAQQAREAAGRGAAEANAAFRRLRPEALQAVAGVERVFRELADRLGQPSTGGSDRFCAQCGHAAAADYRFCRNCGVELRRAAAQTGPHPGAQPAPANGH